jgi:hypothetical protein
MSDKAAGKRKALPDVMDKEFNWRRAEDYHLDFLDEECCGCAPYCEQCSQCDLGEAVLAGNIAVVEQVLQDDRADPSRGDNHCIRVAAQHGHVAIVERLLQDKRVDPSAGDNYAVRIAAYFGELAIVKLLLRDARVDPSSNNNEAIEAALLNGNWDVVALLLEDDRVDFAVDVEDIRPEDRKLFECRERLTEICIGLQDMQLPAWVTLQILDAARPWSTLELHSKWALACAVKHFHDRRPRTSV